MKEYLKKHTFNFRGKAISRKLVVIESDDWGSIRIPNKIVSEKLATKGLLNSDDPFDTIDSLETEADIQALLEVLSKFKDSQGESPVFTANMVMGNPDFHQIEKNNFSEYFFETFTDTYKRYPQSSGNFGLLNEGIENGLIVPQFHAREHLNIILWMRYLQEGDPNFLWAFKERCFSIKDKAANNRRKNIMAAYDYYSKEDLENISKAIREGVALYESIFKRKSETTICPCYVWDSEIEKIFKGLGISAYQGSKYQNIPLSNTTKFKRQLRYMGQKERGNTYFIRNCLFEPSLNDKIDWVDKCLESIKVAFFWKKPAIIGSHRINFSGAIEPTNRENNLKKLESLLLEILKKWPEVEFISSAELMSIYE